MHANVNSMANRGSSQPGDSINQIISQIIQRDRSAADDHSADIFGDDRRLFTSPANNVGGGSDTGQQQSTSETIPETGNNATSQSDPRGEFEALQLLTQYIGPRKPNPVQTSRHGDSPSNLVDQHMSRFKEVFLEKTDKLDRARSHLDSLTRAVQKNRIPNKLRINVKPLVIDKENPTFVRKWNDAIRRAELELTKIIIEHLQDVIQQTNAIIRETTEKTYHALRAADITIDEAKKALEDTLKQADSARKAKNEARQKRKLETAANNLKNKKHKKEQ